MIARTVFCLLDEPEYIWRPGATKPVTLRCPAVIGRSHIVGEFYPEFWDSFTLFQCAENDNAEKVLA